MKTTEKDKLLEFLETAKENLEIPYGAPMEESVERVIAARNQVAKAIKLVTLLPTFDSVEELQDYDYDPYTY